jgi:hypothetical protein
MITCAIRVPIAGCAAALLVGLGVAGCGGASEARYIPTAEKARQSLTAALDAWAAGEPHATVQAGEYTVDMYDARWRDGAKLESYEFVSEGTDEGHPTFAVKTRVKGQDAETTYHVIGINPMNVFRAEDYRKASGM